MKQLIFIALAAFLLQGCKDIIAENIAGRTPVIIVPSNGQTVSQNPVHFKWEVMSGATKYRLQVASPNFENISDYALDSVITGTEFYMPLDSNSYELKLTAMNAGYTSNTLDSVYFTVGVAPSGGTGNTVVLETPEDSAYYKSADVFASTFNWTDLSNASYYEFYLKKGSSFSGGTQIEYFPHLNPPNVSLETTSFTEGQYHWGVRAYLEDETETAISKRKFFIDTTKPNIPVLISPNSVVNPGNIVFTWSNGSDPGIVHAPVSSVLEVAEDQNFTVNAQSIPVNGATTTVNLLGFGVRYWRIRNKDSAGNESNYSATGQFTMN